MFVQFVTLQVRTAFRSAVSLRSAVVCCIGPGVRVVQDGAGRMGWSFAWSVHPAFGSRFGTRELIGSSSFGSPSFWISLWTLELPILHPAFGMFFSRMTRG